VSARSTWKIHGRTRCVLSRKERFTQVRGGAGRRGRNHCRIC
jgi:hypothetical protein